MGLNKLLDVGTVSKRVMATSLFAVGIGTGSFVFGLHEIGTGNDFDRAADYAVADWQREEVEEMADHHYKLGELAMKGGMGAMVAGSLILVYAPDQSRRPESTVPISGTSEQTA